MNNVALRLQLNYENFIIINSVGSQTRPTLAAYACVPHLFKTLILRSLPLLALSQDSFLRFDFIELVIEKLDGRVACQYY